MGRLEAVHGDMVRFSANVDDERLVAPPQDPERPIVRWPERSPVRVVAYENVLRFAKRWVDMGLRTAMMRRGHRGKSPGGLLEDRALASRVPGAGGVGDELPRHMQWLAVDQLGGRSLEVFLRGRPEAL